MKMVYTAFSKRCFYFRQHISRFVLQHNCVPLNPFMIHEYFMLDTVDRQVIRDSNNILVERCDEVWVFGHVSDGVLEEIRLAKKHSKVIRYFTIVDSKEIEEISKESVLFEEGLESFSSEL